MKKTVLRQILYLSVLLVTGLLAACGGGSGGSSAKDNSGSAATAEEAALVTEVINYDGSTDYTKQLVVTDSDEVSSLAADVSLSNISLPTNARGDFALELVYTPKDQAPGSDYYTVKVRTLIRSISDTVAVHPIINLCQDETACQNGGDGVGLIFSDFDTELSQETVADTQTASVAWDSIENQFIFSYGSETKIQPVTNLNNYMAVFTSYNFPDDFDFHEARIITRNKNINAGDDFSLTAHIDNVYVNDTLYDVFSSGEIDDFLWDYIDSSEEE